MRPAPPPIHRLSDTIIRTLELHGAPPEVIAAARAQAPDAAAPAADEPTCPIWADNARSVQVFLACSRYWQRAGMDARRTHFDWDGVRAYLHAHQPTRRHRALLRDLYVMEAAVLEADAELAEHKQNHPD